MTLVHNEQTKLRATLLNTIAPGFVIAGVITPIASSSLTGVAFTSATLVLMIIWFVMAVILHYGAMLVLETMQ